MAMEEGKQEGRLRRENDDPELSFNLRTYDEREITSFWEDTDEKTQKAVQTLADLARDDQGFRIKVSPRLSAGEKEYLSTCDLDFLEETMQRYLSQAKAEQDAYQQNPRGTRQAGRITVEFMNNLKGYMEVYSGFSQLMNGAGSGYGDAASGALSLLLVVAVHKKRAEDATDDLICRLRQEFDRLQRLKEVHATSKMKEHLARLYKLGIEFSREAVFYYSTSRWRRLCHLIGRPPSMYLEIKVQKINDTIEQMDREMRTIDSRRLYDVERRAGAIDTRVQGLQKDLMKVESGVEAIHSRKEVERLNTIRDILGAEDQNSGAFIQKCIKRLSDVFDQIPRYPPFDIDSDLCANRNFRSWHDNDDSSLLILQGDTIVPHDTFLSWLSVAAARLVERPEKYLQGLQEVQAPNLIHFSCQAVDDHSRVASMKGSPSVVVSTLIYQVLQKRQARSLLRDDYLYDELKQRIDTLKSEPHFSDHDQSQALFAVLSDLLRMFGSEKIYLVIDRIDRIGTDLKLFLAPLLNLFEGNSPVLKAFLITPDGLEGNILGGKVGSERVFEITAHQGG